MDFAVLLLDSGSCICWEFGIWKVWGHMMESKMVTSEVKCTCQH